MTTTGGSSTKNTTPSTNPRSAPRQRKKRTDTASVTSIFPCSAATRHATSDDQHPVRTRMRQQYAKKWVNGTVLHYYFFNRNSDGPGGLWAGSASQKAIIRRAFCEWKDMGMGLEFREVSNREEAEFRIGFSETEESWSFVGRDAIDIAHDPDERTMNFGANLTTKAGRNRALDEIGRALGFSQSGEDIASSLDWELATAVTQRVYPPLSRFVETELVPLKSMPLQISAGEQTDVRIRPQLSRAYTIQIIGQSDVVMVLFEDVGGLDLFEEMDRELEYVAGDDDSGGDRSALLITRLCRDREYVLRVRLLYSKARNGTAILLS